MTDDGMKYPVTKLPFASTPFATATPITPDWFATGPPELPKSRCASVRIHPSWLMPSTEPVVDTCVRDFSYDSRNGYPTIQAGSSSSGSCANFTTVWSHGRKTRM